MKSIQEYDTSKKYNCIIFRYCIGYLKDDAELAEELKRYAAMLDSNNTKRTTQQEGYLIVQDQVGPEGTVDGDNSAQEVRTLSRIEKIFAAADLKVVNSADHPEELITSIFPVRVWVLCPAVGAKPGDTWKNAQT